MCQRPLTKEQREMLSSSPHVIKMTDVYVFFSSSFINKFCIDYHAGKTADAIFLEAGKERIHGVLGYMPPIQYRKQHSQFADANIAYTNSLKNRTKKC